RRQHREIADRKPHQSAELVVEAANRIPRRDGSILKAEMQPSIPGEILELDGADEHRRAQPRERIETDILDPGGIATVEDLMPLGVADDHRPASGGEPGNQIALQIDAR